MPTQHHTDNLTEAHWSDIKTLYHQMLDARPEQRSTLIQQSDQAPFVKQYVQHLLSRDGITVALPVEDINSLLEELQHKYQSGDQIGVYRLVRPLGQGGMGLVFLAERTDGVYQQQVAIKLMLRHFHTPLERQMFVQERQILARLQHPHIARLIDGGEIDQRPYLVMEYIEGTSLMRYVTSEALTLEDRLGVMAQLLSAVAYAHQRAVIHKDLKPANILVDQSGHAHLIDFGIARAEQPEMTESVDSQAHTPAYASPEQKEGGEVTAASDVHALGQILMDLISTAPDLSRLSAFRRRQLEAIAHRARAPAAGDRYPTVTELAQDIVRWQQRRAVTAKPQTRLYRLRTFVQRNWLICTVLSVSFVLTAVALVTALRALQAQVHSNEALLESQQQTEQESLKLSQINAFLTRMFDAIQTDASGVDVRVVDVLDRAAVTLQAAPSMSPIIKAELAMTLARAFTAIDQNETALELLERAQQQAREQLGEGHQQTDQIRQAMIGLWMRHSAFDQVRDRGLEWVTRLRDADPASPAALKLSIQVAEAEYWMDDKVVALDRLGQTRAQIEQQLGGDHDLMTFHDETLAVLFLWDQRAEEAEEIFRQLIDRHLEKPDHSIAELFKRYQWLSFSLYEQQQYDAAIAVGRRMIELGRQHQLSNIQLAGTYNNIATFQQGDGDMTGSIETLLEAVHRFTPVLGENHYNIRSYHANLGDAYQALKDYEAALSWYQKSLSLSQILNDEFGDRQHRLVIQIALCLARTGQQLPSRQVLDQLSAKVESNYRISALGGNYHLYQGVESYWSARFESMDTGLSMIERWHDDATGQYGVDHYVTQALLELRLELYQALGLDDRYREFLPQSLAAQRSIR